MKRVAVENEQKKMRKERAERKNNDTLDSFA